MLQTLPIELHELIVSHLDKPSTLSYSLTCHRFIHPARRHLFETIVLTFCTQSFDGKAQSPASFLSFLASSPYICNVVKSLFVRTASWMPGFEQIDQDNVLPRCLSLLKNLKNFGLRPLPDGISWEDLSIPALTTSRSIAPVLRTQNIACFSIDGLYFSLFSLPQVFPALRGLSFDRNLFEGQTVINFWNDYWDPPFENSCMLQKLKLSLFSGSLRFFVEWVRRPTCPLKISQLQSLSMKITGRDQDNVRSILQACAGSLEVLCLGIGHIRDPITLDIGILSRLRVLRLHFPGVPRFLYDAIQRDFSYTHPWLANIFSSTTVLDHLEEISIKTSLISSFDAVPNLSPWVSLATSFSTGSVISRLRSLKVFFVLPERAPAWTMDIDIGKVMYDNCPTLSERGILKVHRTDEDGSLAGFHLIYVDRLCGLIVM